MNYNYSNLSIFVGHTFISRFDSNSLISSILSFVSNFSYLISSFHVISRSLGEITVSELGLGASLSQCKSYYKYKKT